MDTVTAVVVLILGVFATAGFLASLYVADYHVALYLSHRFPGEPTKAELVRLEAMFQGQIAQLTKDLEEVRDAANSNAVALALRSDD